jgi:DNA-binding transcriptional ArsR family regulator
MGVTKAQAFSPEQNRLAELAKAIGHPARVAILQHLAAQKSCVCGYLVGVLPLAQATVSQHLKELKAAGLVQGEVDGTSVCYCLNPNGMAELAAFLDQLTQASNCQGGACCP